MADDFKPNAKPDYLTLGYYGANKLLSMIPTKKGKDFKFNPLRLRTRPVTLQNFDREKNELATRTRIPTQGSSLAENTIARLGSNAQYNNAVVQLGGISEQARLSELNRIDQANMQEDFYNAQGQQQVDNMNADRSQRLSSQIAMSKANQSAASDEGLLNTINATRQARSNQRNAYTTLKAQDKSLQVNSILSQLQNPNLPIDSPERSVLNKQLEDLLQYSPADEYKNSLKKEKGGKITFKKVLNADKE